MIVVDYRNRRGGLMKKPVAESEEEMASLMESEEGFCLICGNVQEGVEPDARKYRCDNERCGAEMVYGFEVLHVMGLFSPSSRRRCWRSRPTTTTPR